ncbi:hypothetical protein [Microbulbifer epialgicus]|uniref:Uncharacterized protein n=1 Tax=Microbulbifer epialgicus TaxID=393907 RepID=A0ABV4P4W3_9GAMM
MQFLKDLFRKKEEPEATIMIGGVGSFCWDEDSEYWLGKYNGSQISILYDGISQPKDRLGRYVAKALNTQGFIEAKIIDIKNLAKEQCPVEKHSEIDALEVKDIVFQGPDFILIQFFDSEDDEPFWFAEIHGNRIYVGCDT